MFYRVTSRSRAGEIEHIVDLKAFRGSGACSCEAFEFKMRPALEDGAEPSAHLRCLHIRAARWYFADTIIREIVEKFGED
jgi:hypothetical protein